MLVIWPTGNTTLEKIMDLRNFVVITDTNMAAHVPLAVSGAPVCSVCLVWGFC